MNKPTAKDRQWFHTTLNELLRIMGAYPSHVEVFFMEEDENDTTLSIDIHPPYRSYRMNVHPYFWSHSMSEKRRVMIHEILHILTKPLEEARLLEDNLWENAEEFFVDGMSIVINSLLPDEND